MSKPSPIGSFTRPKHKPCVSKVSKYDTAQAVDPNALMWDTNFVFFSQTQEALRSADTEGRPDDGGALEGQTMHL